MPLASHPHLPVPRHRPAARQFPAPRRGGFLLLTLGLGACSAPEAATPVPEPPALDASRIGTGLRPLTDDRLVDVVGEPGATRGGAAVRATNLDSDVGPVESRAGRDGSFSIQVELGLGQELRLQASSGTSRGAPLDWLRTNDWLELSPRHACVEVGAFELRFDAPGSASLELTNACSENLSVEAPRWRLGLPDFSLPEAFPLVIEPDRSGSLAVNFERQAAGEREDVLFVDVAVEGRTVRYAVNVFAPAP